MSGPRAESLRHPVQRRLRWLAGRSCPCGSVDRLQVQYPPGMPKNIWTRSEAALAAALPRLGALCWECHYNALFARQGTKRAAHGSLSMYRKGCRCQACHDINVAVKKAARAPKPAPVLQEPTS